MSDELSCGSRCMRLSIVLHLFISGLVFAKIAKNGGRKQEPIQKAVCVLAVVCVPPLKPIAGVIVAGVLGGGRPPGRRRHTDVVRGGLWLPEWLRSLPICRSQREERAIYIGDQVLPLAILR